MLKYYNIKKLSIKTITFEANLKNMKKITAFMALLLTGIVFSQTEDRKNDIMINPIAFVLGAGNLSYERIINEDSGVGVTASFLIDDYIFEDTNGYQLAPYYHYYFGKKPASGFFVGGYASLTGYRETEYAFSNYNSTPKEENVTAFGMGFKFGGKWVTKNNLLFEVSSGIGRNFGVEDDVDKINTTGMLGIGYRF